MQPAPAPGLPPRTPSAIPEHTRQHKAREIPRRSFLRVSVFAGVTLTSGAFVSGMLGFFNARNPSGFGGFVTVPANQVPMPGRGPARFSSGKFYLVNLNGADGDVFSTGARGGVLAIYWKCTHLGCTVPWNPEFQGAAVNFPAINGWFRCPCHGSIFSRAGVRVYGPAPRSLDLMRMDVGGDGSVTVDTGSIIPGTIGNPLAAVPYSA